jgi:hypothetical protein
MLDAIGPRRSRPLPGFPDTMHSSKNLTPPFGEGVCMSSHLDDVPGAGRSALEGASASDSPAPGSSLESKGRDLSMARNIVGVLCPYCAAVSSDIRKCQTCGGYFDPLSRQATQNDMGPWFLLDRDHPSRPGCSYEKIRELAKSGKVRAGTIIRGPTTKQFWTFASRAPSIANLVGYCHNCHAKAGADDFSCKACGAVFTPDTDRQHLGLAPVHRLPGRDSPAMIAASAMGVGPSTATSSSSPAAPAIAASGPAPTVPTAEVEPKPVRPAQPTPTPTEPVTRQPQPVPTVQSPLARTMMPAAASPDAPSKPATVAETPLTRQQARETEGLAWHEDAPQRSGAGLWIGTLVAVLAIGAVGVWGWWTLMNPPGDQPGRVSTPVTKAPELPPTAQSQPQPKATELPEAKPMPSGIPAPAIHPEQTAKPGPPTPDAKPEPTKPEPTVPELANAEPAVQRAEAPLSPLPRGKLDDAWSLPEKPEPAPPLPAAVVVVSPAEAADKPNEQEALPKYEQTRIKPSAVPSISEPPGEGTQAISTPAKQPPEPQKATLDVVVPSTNASIFSDILALKPFDPEGLARVRAVIGRQQIPETKAWLEALGQWEAGQRLRVLGHER